MIPENRASLVLLSYNNHRNESVGRKRRSGGWNRTTAPLHTTRVRPSNQPHASHALFSVSSFAVRIKNRNSRPVPARNPVNMRPNCDIEDSAQKYRERRVMGQVCILSQAYSLSATASFIQPRTMRFWC